MQSSGRVGDVPPHPRSSLRLHNADFGSRAALAVSEKNLNRRDTDGVGSISGILGKGSLPSTVVRLKHTWREKYEIWGSDRLMMKSGGMSG